jgi:uncharacterized protein YdhG (YjbR/CyaY superfamily)
MKSEAKTPKQYVDELSEDRKQAVEKLRKIILKNLPKGFEETMSYGMIGYVVPHSIYPDGYHCDPKLPLPFMTIGSQKNFIAVHHMGIYADPKLLEWFTQAHAKQINTKLDMGKGCLRFKKVETIPYELIGELASKVTPKDWIKTYESAFKKPSKKK